jgi:hypothetical protein
MDESRGVVDMYCSDVDVGDGNIGLCYDGKNRAGRSIGVMLCLIVYNDTRRRGRW